MNNIIKILQFFCGLFKLHKWETFTKGQMCKRCGKKRYMDKWSYELKEKL